MPKAVSSRVTRTSLLRRLAGLFALSVIVAAISYPPPVNAVIDVFNSTFGTKLGHVEKGFVLGLDLQGGTRLEYEANVSNVAESERAAAVEGARDVIERRVNTLGVSEPVVTTARVGDTWRISAELAGVRDVNEAITLIGETPILEFKEPNTDPPRELTAEERKRMDDANAAAKKSAEDTLAKAKADPGVFEQLVRETSTDAASKSLGGDLGFLKSNVAYSALYTELKGEPVGVVGRVLESADAYVVAKVEEVKDAGTEIRASHILIQWAGATGASASTTASKEEARALIDRIKGEVTPENFTELAKKYSMEPGAKDSGGDLGWFGSGAMVKEFETGVFKLQKGQISDVIETPFGYHIAWKQDERPQSDVRVRAAFYRKTVASDIAPNSEWKNTELTGKNLKRAVVAFDQTGVPQISLQFDDEGAKLFGDITKRNVGKQVAIFLDGEALSVPTVQSEITGGQAVITGTFSIAEAKLLAQRLQAGALPVPIALIAQQSVGPTLGQSSVDQSLRAGLFGFLFIAIFMLALYRLPGSIAIVSLGLYVGISFALFKLVPVTLTLSGIAGFILSLGIAVDANVLVFERLKEELRAGKEYATALEEAFRRAWSSIRDGNVTTLISCGVLYWFSSSVIKGFALTLAIGIVVSLFTSLLVARTLLRAIARTRLPAMLAWFFLNRSRDNA